MTDNTQQSRARGLSASTRPWADTRAVIYTADADAWCADYCDRNRSELCANLSLVERSDAIQRASWMDPAPARVKCGLIARVFKFFGFC